MKFSVIVAFLFAAALVVVAVAGCASGVGVVSDPSAAQTSGTVPGEKLPDDERVVPGAFGNPNPSVRW
jgi:hypothetical protein